MSILTGLLAVVAAATASLLVLTILLQQPRDGGLSSLLGGGVEAGLATAPSVARFTRVVAGVWIVACAALAFVA